MTGLMLVKPTIDAKRTGYTNLHFISFTFDVRITVEIDTLFLKDFNINKH